MKNLVKGMIFSLFAALAFQSSAQYNGPSKAVTITTVKDVLSNASSYDKKDVKVTLKGYVIEKVSEEKYWFKDETGKVLLDIEPKHFPSFKFDEKTLVQIEGEVDHEVLEGTEIEVDSITLVK